VFFLYGFRLLSIDSGCTAGFYGNGTRSSMTWAAIWGVIRPSRTLLHEFPESRAIRARRWCRRGCTGRVPLSDRERVLIVAPGFEQARQVRPRTINVIQLAILKMFSFTEYQRAS
jgi:hypothetical protein